MLSLCRIIFHPHFHLKTQRDFSCKGIWVYGRSPRIHRGITVYFSTGSREYLLTCRSDGHKSHFGGHITQLSKNKQHIQNNLYRQSTTAGQSVWKDAIHPCVQFVARIKAHLNIPGCSTRHSSLQVKHVSHILPVQEFPLEQTATKTDAENSDP